MSRMEARLLKSGRLEEFNRQFEDNVDRGMFKPIPKEEADRYKGAVNYISMVEAFKTGPHATTPLRICMNSSMRQPKPSGVSLNACLQNGAARSGRLVLGNPRHPGAQGGLHQGHIQILPVRGGLKQPST
jgi:hypothetical protein